MSYKVPLDPEERQALIDARWERAIYAVCYQCGAGGHSKTTLYWNGKTEEGEPIYACSAHRGLLGQVRDE